MLVEGSFFSLSVLCLRTLCAIFFNVVKVKCGILLLSWLMFLCLIFLSLFYFTEKLNHSLAAQANKFFG